MVARSPNYPALSLREAVEVAGVLHQKAKRASVSSMDAIQALGYSGKTGSSLRVLASLRQYGLVDGLRDKVRVSDLALRILFPPSIESNDYISALRQAANAPKIFSEIFSEYPEIPDSGIIRSYLINRKDFTPEAAERCVRTFQETVEFARIGESGYIGNQDAAIGVAGEPQGGQMRLPIPVQPVDSKWSKVISFPISDGTTATLTISGERPTPDEIDIMFEHLEIIRRTLKKSREPEPGGESSN